MLYFFFFLLAFLFSLFITLVARGILRHFKVVDLPPYQNTNGRARFELEDRKIHRGKIPYGGGLAIFVSFFMVVAIVFWGTDYFSLNVTYKELLAIFIGGLVLMIGGLLDDLYVLRARQQIWFPVLAAVIVVAFGVGPSFVTNPFGGSIDLDKYNLGFITLANILVFLWLMGMMFTTKFLDGLDGLVGGVVSIGALMIGFLSLQNQWYQPDTALLSIVFAGAVLGFLVWNFHPAKIFLGEGGSLFTGFMLGSLAIISGGKIATTLLVIGIPMLDVGRVIMARLKKGKPIYQGDNEHLHYKLLKSGLSHKQAVLLLYSISFLFGITTLFLQSRQKLMALAFLFVLMLLLGVWVSRKE